MSETQTSPSSSKIDPIQDVIESTSLEQVTREQIPRDEDGSDNEVFIRPGAYRVHPLQVPDPAYVEAVPGEDNDANDPQENAHHSQLIDQLELVNGVVVDETPSINRCNLDNVIIYAASVVTFCILIVYLLIRNPTSPALSICPEVRSTLISIVGEDALNDISSLRYQCGRIICDEKLFGKEGDENTIINTYLFLLSTLSMFTEVDLHSLRPQHHDPILCDLIICNANDSVSVLPIRNVADTNNGGTIPSEIGLLSDMIVLDMKNNNLVGTIPTELGMMRKLRILDLQNNRFTGTIPSEIFQIETLEFLLFDKNSLRGDIPSTVVNSSSLQYLGLSKNLLNGSIPLGMKKTGLKGLDIHGNNFVGNVQFLCDNNFTNDIFHFEEYFGTHFLTEYSYVRDFRTGLIVGCNNSETLYSCDCCICGD